MRKRDLHILTSNIYTYTGDQRFSVIHPPNSEDWDLKIEYVQPRDSGIYECQVNTEPKINLAISLKVTGIVLKTVLPNVSSYVLRVCRLDFIPNFIFDQISARHASNTVFQYFSVDRDVGIHFGLSNSDVKG